METKRMCEDCDCGGALEAIPVTPEQFADYDRVICSDVVVRFVGGYARLVCDTCGKRGGIRIPNLHGLIDELAIAVVLTPRKLTYTEERALVTACDPAFEKGVRMPERQFRIRAIRTLTEGDNARRRECIARLFALRIEDRHGRQRITVTHDGENNLWSIVSRELIPYEFEG